MKLQLGMKGAEVLAWVLTAACAVGYIREGWQGNELLSMLYMCTSVLTLLAGVALAAMRLEQERRDGAFKRYVENLCKELQNEIASRGSPQPLNHC